MNNSNDPEKSINKQKILGSREMKFSSLELSNITPNNYLIRYLHSFEYFFFKNISTTELGPLVGRISKKPEVVNCMTHSI